MPRKNTEHKNRFLFWTFKHKKAVLKHGADLPLTKVTRPSSGSTGRRVVVVVVVVVVMWRGRSPFSMIQCGSGPTSTRLRRSSSLGRVSPVITAFINNNNTQPSSHWMRRPVPNVVKVQLFSILLFLLSFSSPFPIHFSPPWGKAQPTLLEIANPTTRCLVGFVLYVIFRWKYLRFQATKDHDKSQPKFCDGLFLGHHEIDAYETCQLYHQT